MKPVAISTDDFLKANIVRKSYEQFNQCNVHTASGIAQVLAFSNLDEAHKCDTGDTLAFVMGCLDAPADLPTGDVLAFEFMGRLMISPRTTARPGWMRELTRRAVHPFRAAQ